jgi:NAD(P)-dependent dehydrogenase (short-subunit alcohol dehydrogenase family)
VSKLQGKVAIITGGSSGIGLATAMRFIAEGAHVFITGRRQTELDKAVAQLGKNVTAIQGDVANLADLDRLYETVAAKKSKIDIVFANAAFVEFAPTTAVTPEHFDKTFNTNARGAYFTVQKALPLMNDGGSIILVGNTGKEKGFQARGTYNASKAALRSFVRTWTTELKDRKIRANMISPGAIETPIIDGLFPSKEMADAARAHFASVTPLGRLGRPEEIASAALFLASDESSYIAGIDLPVDGGLAAV